MAGTVDTDLLLKSISNPFQSQARSSNNIAISTCADNSQIASASVTASTILSVCFVPLLIVAFCILRPRKQNIYARKVESKHLGDGMLMWWKYAVAPTEHSLVEAIGMDAVVLIRFLRMCRNIFLVLSVLGCTSFIPILLMGNHRDVDYHDITVLMRLTPVYSRGQRFWGYVVCAYLFDATIMVFLWYNHHAIGRLREHILCSIEHRNSPHSHALLAARIPNDKYDKQELESLFVREGLKPSQVRIKIGVDFTELSDVLRGHSTAVKAFEAAALQIETIGQPRVTWRKAYHATRVAIAKRDITRLPGNIVQYEKRIAQLRGEQSRFQEEPYAIVQYDNIEAARIVLKEGAPHGITVEAAPKPADLIWKNLSMEAGDAQRNRLWNSFIMVALTVLFIVPNVLVAVFLSNFSNIALVWPSFEQNLDQHRNTWAMIQGILAPCLQSAFYMVLPSIYRRLSQNAGDRSKTMRERHVLAKLYAFFIFNKLLMFSSFAALWTFFAAAFALRNGRDPSIWNTVKQTHVFSDIVSSLCTASPYWMSWQLQRSLAAAIDLLQLWPLVQAYVKQRWVRLTDREKEELQKPVIFKYADHYNGYLFSMTIGLCLCTIQPLILPVTAVFIALEACFKSYLLQFVFATKIESDGQFWEDIADRILFAMVLGNVMTALVVGAQGAKSSGAHVYMMVAMIPLPLLAMLFRWQCRKSFGRCHPSTNSDAPRGRSKESKQIVEYEHPVVSQKLIKPMVPPKWKNLLERAHAQ